MKWTGVTGKMKARSWPRDGLLLFGRSDSKVCWEWLIEVHIRAGV